MTELLEEPVEVRLAGDGAVTAVRLPTGGWREVVRTVNRWVVETDWWRTPVRRDYRRCLLRGDDCVEVYADHGTGRWWLSRRYD